MTSIEEELVNSRAPATAIYLRAALAFIAVVYASVFLGIQTCMDNGAWFSIAMRLLVDQFPTVGHLKCIVTVIAVYIKCFGCQKGGSSELPRIPPATGW